MIVPYFKAIPADNITELHTEAKAALRLLPVLQIQSGLAPENDDLDDISCPPDAQAATGEIPESEIIELAHLSHSREKEFLRWSGNPQWADHLAVQMEHIKAITSEQSPERYAALYLIKVHAPQWPTPTDDATPIVNPLRRASGVRECSLAFNVLPGQFAIIPVRYCRATNWLIKD